jgi:hypothetical protein
LTKQCFFSIVSYMYDPESPHDRHASTAAGARSSRAIALSAIAACVLAALSYRVGKDVEWYEMTGCPVDSAGSSDPVEWVAGPIANTIGAMEDSQGELPYCSEQFK